MKLFDFIAMKKEEPRGRFVERDTETINLDKVVHIMEHPEDPALTRITLEGKENSVVAKGTRNEIVSKMRTMESR